jgi:hypothetical protein
VISDAALRQMDDNANVDVTSDQYVGLERALSRGGDGETLLARVNKRVRDEEGNPVGNANDNPLLDSRKYKVEYADGHVEELTANIIAENLIVQVDEEGRRQMMNWKAKTRMKRIVRMKTLSCLTMKTTVTVITTMCIVQ